MAWLWGLVPAVDTGLLGCFPAVNPIQAQEAVGSFPVYTPSGSGGAPLFSGSPKGIFRQCCASMQDLGAKSFHFCWVGAPWVTPSQQLVENPHPRSPEAIREAALLTCWRHLLVLELWCR